MYTLNLDNMTTGAMTEYFGTLDEMVQRFDLEQESFEREGWTIQSYYAINADTTCTWRYTDGETVIVNLCEVE